jgi:hypothetical protein
MNDDLSNPDFAGFLFKQSTWFREWRQRYFVLKGNRIFFSKSPETAYHGVVRALASACSLLTPTRLT